MKKVISVILTVCLLLVTSVNTVFATELDVKNINLESKKEEILKIYREKLLEVEFSYDDDVATNSRGVNNKSKFDLILDIQAETVAELNKAGYEAYDVNPQTFKNVENTLQTDLEEAGLNSDGAYIITLNERLTAYPNALTSDPFSHTYGGTTYSLRWMTIRASDDPLMGKTDSVDLLDSPSRQVIINCLNTAINAYLSSINYYLGTVASIIGLDIEDFAPSQNVSLEFRGSTNWTRRFTQVWSDYYEEWSNGCFVEEMTTYSHIYGDYYDAQTNRYKTVNTAEQYITKESQYFNDWNWRKDRAVMGYLNSYIYKDSVGDAEYRYGGRVIIRHNSNF